MKSETISEIRFNRRQLISASLVPFLENKRPVALSRPESLPVPQEITASLPSSDIDPTVDFEIEDDLEDIELLDEGLKVMQGVRAFFDTHGLEVKPGKKQGYHEAVVEGRVFSMGYDRYLEDGDFIWDEVEIGFLSESADAELFVVATPEEVYIDSNDFVDSIFQLLPEDSLLTFRRKLEDLFYDLRPDAESDLIAFIAKAKNSQITAEDFDSIYGRLYGNGIVNFSRDFLQRALQGDPETKIHDQYGIVDDFPMDVITEGNDMVSLGNTTPFGTLVQGVYSGVNLYNATIGLPSEIEVIDKEEGEAFFIDGDDNLTIGTITAGDIFLTNEDKNS